MCQPKATIYSATRVASRSPPWIERCTFNTKANPYVRRKQKLVTIRNASQKMATESSNVKVHGRTAQMPVFSAPENFHRKVRVCRCKGKSAEHPFQPVCPAKKGPSPPSPWLLLSGRPISQDKATFFVASLLERRRPSWLSPSLPPLPPFWPLRLLDAPSPTPPRAMIYESHRGGGGGGTNKAGGGGGGGGGRRTTKGEPSLPPRRPESLHFSIPSFLRTSHLSQTSFPGLPPSLSFPLLFFFSRCGNLKPPFRRVSPPHCRRRRRERESPCVCLRAAALGGCELSFHSVLIPIFRKLTYRMIWCGSIYTGTPTVFSFLLNFVYRRIHPSRAHILPSRLQLKSDTCSQVKRTHIFGSCAIVTVHEKQRPLSCSGYVVRQANLSKLSPNRTKFISDQNQTINHTISNKKDTTKTAN